MKLAYRAFDTAGRSVSDTIEAANSTEAADKLRRQGLYATQITQASAASAAPSAGKPRKKKRSPGGTRRLKNLAVFSRQLHMLVSSGTPIVEALRALEKQNKAGPWRDVLSGIRERVEEGDSLSEAMRQYHECFDSVSLSLISVGESGGMLPEMLKRQAELTRKRLKVRSSIVGAMIYPALLITVALGVLGVMFVFVIPRFSELFKTLDVPLPGSTKALIWFSNVCKSYWWAMALAVVGMATAAKLWLRTPKGRRFLDTLVLRLPKFGKIVRNFATARLARLLGVLLGSHVPLLEALALTQRSMGNVHYCELVGKAEDAVTHGEPLSSAFADEKLIEPSVYQAVHNGEQSGRVGDVLTNIADFLDEENDVVVRTLTSIIEPVILIILGGLVALVALSMFMPMFDLTAMT